MTPQLQRHLGQDGVSGDCHRTCLAMVLDLDRDDVPHFMVDVPYNAPADHPACLDATAAEAAFCAAHGVTPAHVPYDGALPLDDLCKQIALFMPNTAVILGCKVVAGLNHSVVIYNGTIYNPNPMAGALVAGPMNDGVWWVTIYPRATKPLPADRSPANVATQETD